MFFFFLFVSLTNLAVGYIVAVKFHSMLFAGPAREREMVRPSGELVGPAPAFSIDATQIPLVNHQQPAKTISPQPPSKPEPVGKEENPLAELKLSLNPISTPEESAPPAEAISSAARKSEAPSEPESASVDDFMRGISAFRAQLSALDLRIRNCAKSPDTRQIEGCVQEFRKANTCYLEQTSEVKDRLNRAESIESKIANDAREAIQQALEIQVQEVKLTEVKLTQLNIEADPEGSCETLLNTAHALSSSNDKLRDEMVLAKRDLQPEPEPEQEEVVLELDEMTQIPSRQMFDVELQREIKRGETFCLAIVDVDHCSQLNLNYGPAVIDEVLKAIARIVAASARGGCRAARYSGQQFSVLFPAYELADVAQAVERIRQIIQLTEFKHDETCLDVSVSVTVIEGNAGDSLQKLEQQMSEAIAKAKNTGSNQSFQVRADEVEVIPPPELDLQANSYEV
jgi:diguanylate cyclase (GGDEF)-like protein